MTKEEDNAITEPASQDADNSANQPQEGDPNEVLLDGIASQQPGSGDAQTGQQDGEGDSQQGGEPPADEPSGEDNSLTEPGGKSYEELRKKLNEQGIEKNKYKEQALQLESEVSELKTQIEELQEELNAYKDWYSKYYPALNELWQDEEIRKRIEASQGGSKSLSQEEVRRLLDEQVAQKLQEYETQKEFERSVDRWLDSHPDVKGQLAKDLYDYLERYDLTPTPEILDMAYTYLTKDKRQAAATATQVAAQQKIQEASVGGGVSRTSGQKPKNPVDDLFAIPESKFYPNAV